MIRILAVVLLIAIALSAYGYYFNASHGYLYVTVMDNADRGHSLPVVPVELSFLDSSGSILAQAQGIDPSGTIYLSSPQIYACRDDEQRATLSLEARREWDRCFERQSRWVPTWARRIKSVDLQSGSCRIHSMHVSLSEHPDTWWLWWVPLRDIGGKPYTTFRIAVEFNQKSCGLPR